MNTQLTSMLAKQHLDDLYNSAERRRWVHEAARGSGGGTQARTQLSRLATHLRRRLRQASTAALASPKAPRAEAGHERC
jgi:hypothetical protein